MAAMDAIGAIRSIGVSPTQRYFNTATVRTVRGEISPVSAAKAVQGPNSLEAQIRVAKASNEATGRLVDIKI